MDEIINHPLFFLEIKAMIVNVDLPKYNFLKKGLQNYCLLRQIVRKQYEHCKILEIYMAIILEQVLVVLK